MASQFLGNWITHRSVRTRPGRPVRLAFEALEERAVASATDLGAATNYNAFVFNDYTARYTDAGGAVAVGHDANFTGYGVGSRLPNSHGTQDELVVGHNLTYNQGEVFNGNAVYGGTGKLQHVGFPNGSPRQAASPVDFAAAQADLTGKSAKWGGISPNGVTEDHYGTITLTGGDPQLNVFSVTQSQLAGCHGLAINAPAGSTVLINVIGTNPTMQNFGMWMTGTDRTHVLFNFPTAQTLTIKGIDVEASILAPKANVRFNNGRMVGDLIANNLSGNGQLDPAAPRLDINPPPPATASFDGQVYQGEGHDVVGVPNITVVLTLKNALGGVVSTRTATSQNDGTFHFGTLPAGNYDLSLSLTGTSYQVLSEKAGNAAATLGPPDGTISDIQIDVGQAVNGFGFQVFQAAA